MTKKEQRSLVFQVVWLDMALDPRGLINVVILVFSGTNQAVIINYQYFKIK